MKFYNYKKIMGRGKTLSFILSVFSSLFFSNPAVSSTQSPSGVMSVTSSNEIVLDAPVRMQVIVESEPLAYFSSYKVGLTIMFR